MKDTGVDPTRDLCSSGDMKVGRDVMRVVAGMDQVVKSQYWPITFKLSTCNTDPGHDSSSHTTMSSVPHDSQAAVLLAHVVAQIQSNIDFLLAQNYISPSDVTAIVSRLPAANLVDQLASRTQAMSVGAPQTPVRRGIPAPPSGRKTQAKALWAYNVDGHVCLSYLNIRRVIK